MHPKSIRAKLLQQFSHQNNINPPIQLQDVDWTNIEVWLQNNCNSRVTIRSNIGSKYFTGNQVIYFNRYPIARALTGVLIPRSRNDYETIHDVIIALKAKIGIPVETEEFADGPLDGDTVTLRPSVRSMAYMPTSVVELGFEK